MTAGLDLDALTAIDVHVHAEVSSRGGGSLPAELEAASSAYFKLDDTRRPTLGEIAAYYRERRMACVVFTVDAEAASGQPPVPNEEVAEAAAEHPDVIIPFASIDPARGRAGAGRPAAWSPSTASVASSSTPACRGSSRTTAPPTSCTR